MGIRTVLTRESTLVEAAQLWPDAPAVFEQMEIDYSCQGARSLADAAKESGYRVEDIINRLDAAGKSPTRSTDWFHESLPALMQFLTSDHQSTIHTWIPQLRNEIEKAIEDMGEIAELRRIRILFRHLTDALSRHIHNEERELFPFIDGLDAANNDPLGAPKMRISQRVLRELVEHEMFRDRLRTLRELAGRLPANNSVDKFRQDLCTFSRDVHHHMHLENNVLYPRAIDIENSLRRSAIATA